MKIVHVLFAVVVSVYVGAHHSVCFCQESPQVEQEKNNEVAAVEPTTQPDVQNIQPQTQAATTVQEEPEQSFEDALDTIDVEDGGNWLIKRQAVEGMIDIIEEIDALFTKIIESRFEFLVQRNQANKEFDLFAQTIGFELGSLDQLISTLFQRLSHEEAEEGDLSQDERDFKHLLQEEKKELEQLQDAVQKILARDAKIDEAVMSIEQQINVSRSYQNQAWRNFQAVKMVWSEEKAQELYQKTEGLLNNLRSIYQTWIKGDLQRYVTDLIQSSRADMQKIKDKIQALKEKGVDLKEQAARIEAEEAQQHKQETVEHVRKELEHEVEKPKKEQGIISWAFSFITAPFKWIWSMISSVVGVK